MWIDLNFRFATKGPIFDNLADNIVNQYARRVEDDLGEEAQSRLRLYLPEQYMYLGHHGGTPAQNPVPPNAGLLAASIHPYRASGDMVIVTDDPVTYGPWIEGTSTLNLIVWPHRRNPPPRRFPGYHAFRVIGEQLDRDAGSIAERHLAYYIGELNA